MNRTHANTRTGQEITAMDKAQIGMEESQRATTEDNTKPIDGLVNETADERSKLSTTRVGATIMDAESTTIVPISIGSIETSSSNDRSAAYLNDTDWNLKMLEHKFTYVRDADWPITAQGGTILTSLSIPKDIIVTAAQKAPFDVTRLWKCRQIVIKIVLKASPFYAGSLGVGFYPYTMTGIPVSSTRLINMGAMIQKVSQNQGLEFVIPFRYHVGFMDAAIQSLGDLHIFVISALRTGPDNPNSISMSIFAAIEDSKFKIPEVIPTSNYVSHKFDKSSYVVTIPEGSLNTVDINKPLSQHSYIKLCDGEGTIGAVGVPHFQDSPTDLVQILKRFRKLDDIVIQATAGKSRTILSVDELYQAAMAGLDDWFGFYRGSVNVRLIPHTADPNFKFSGGVFYISTPHGDYPWPSSYLAGEHYFSDSQIAQFTVPWTQPIFIAPRNVQLLGDLVIFIDNYTTTTTAINLEVWVSVGDDFHMGLYQGSGFSLFKDVAWQPKTVSTVPESGFIDQVSRAIETTLPIVEKVSELGALLDATMITIPPAPVMPRSVGYTIPTDLMQYTERLITTNHNGMSLPDKECFGTSEPETNIVNLLTNTKSVVGYFTWESGSPTGTQLATYKVGCPSEPEFDGQPIFSIPQLFQSWHGGIRIIFDVISTEMHRGQLLIVYTPGAFSPPAYRDATQSYFTTLDLAEGRGTLAIELPYLQQYPYLLTGNADGVDDESQFIGSISVFVQNPLRATSTVAPNVEVIMYQAFSPDVNLAVAGMSKAFTSAKNTRLARIKQTMFPKRKTTPQISKFR